ncbi:MAG: hypothetical protein NW206_14430 [Hyphomonadaceae bacterium]|nr:hypothetical protein [Hyphomonadaceae bacterium]
MNHMILALCLGGAAIGTPLAAAETGAPAATHETMTAETTPIGDLLDHPEARAILERHLPDVVSSDQIDMARPMTLKMIQAYAPDSITDEKLAAVDAELAALAH